MFCLFVCHEKNEEKRKEINSQMRFLKKKTISFIHQIDQSALILIEKKMKNRKTLTWFSPRLSR